MKTRISLIEDVRAITNLTTAERCLMYTLASYANPDGTNVYPSQELLARILGVTDRQVRKLLTSLMKKGHLMLDGKHGYHNKYRLNIPGVTPDQPDIPQEDWESQFLTDKELQDQGLQMVDEEEELEETQPRLRIVRPESPPERSVVVYEPPGVPTTPPVYEPPGLQPKRTPEELLAISVDLVKRRIMSYETFMRGGKKKGYSDEYLNWVLSSGGGGMSDSPNGSQPYNESDLITNVPGKDYQPLNEHIVT